MTMKELLTAVVEGAVVTAEMQEKAQAELAKMAAEAERRAQKAAEKRTSEDAPLLAQAAELLSDHTVRTAKDIGVALNVSTPKATALMRKLEGVKVTEVTVDKRIVKGYSL
jgi:beta-phosphoglucomutase-like phosphatase (HAD superfamily)